MGGILGPRMGLTTEEVQALIESIGLGLGSSAGAALAAAASAGVATTAARSDHVHAWAPKSVYATGGAQALTPVDIGAESSSNRGATNGYCALDGAARVGVGNMPISTFTRLAAVPGFGTTVTATASKVQGRDVFGTLELASAAAVAAFIVCEVETGIGTGVYQALVEARVGVTGAAELRRFPYAFFVPSGCRYRFVAGAGVGVTETVLSHSWREF